MDPEAFIFQFMTLTTSLLSGWILSFCLSEIKVKKLISRPVVRRQNVHVGLQFSNCTQSSFFWTYLANFLYLPFNSVFTLFRCLCYLYFLLLFYKNGWRFCIFTCFHSIVPDFLCFRLIFLLQFLKYVGFPYFLLLFYRNS